MSRPEVSLDDIFTLHAKLLQQNIPPCPIQVELQQLRETAARPEIHPSESLRDFLEHTAEVPGKAIVSLGPAGFCLLTNEQGHLLEFS